MSGGDGAPSSGPGGTHPSPLSIQPASTAPTSPGSERPRWERCSPQVGQPRDCFCRRRIALGAAPRGRQAGNRMESLPLAAKRLHLLRLRSAQARQGRALGALLPAPLCRAGPRRGGNLGTVLTERRGGVSPGGESPSSEAAQAPPERRGLGEGAWPLFCTGWGESTLRCVLAAQKSLEHTEAAKPQWRRWNSPAPCPRPPLRELGLARDARVAPAQPARGIGRRPRSGHRGQGRSGRGKAREAARERCP